MSEMRTAGTADLDADTLTAPGLMDAVFAEHIAKRRLTHQPQRGGLRPDARAFGASPTSVTRPAAPRYRTSSGGRYVRSRSMRLTALDATAPPSASSLRSTAGSTR
jgi:hypothetical protein